LDKSFLFSPSNRFCEICPAPHKFDPGTEGLGREELIVTRMVSDLRCQFRTDMLWGFWVKKNGIFIGCLALRSDWRRLVKEVS
jgi:hypothetical protein